ncbi:MAG: sugar kinase [Chloroflexi bacterium]|nr:sugar kinase [Chloroflexota bacterium]
MRKEDVCALTQHKQMYDVVCFGEAMIRFTPLNFQRLEQATSLEVTVGGSELNAAVGLSRLGLRTAWVSRLVDNQLGRMIASRAMTHGVDVSHVVWTKEGRVGLYFIEMGASPRASQVLYDRSHSAIAGLVAEEIDWPALLKGTRVFHTSGITPALSRPCAEATEAALSAAKDNHCLATFDLNYRARLWTKDEARQTLSQLFRYVDILLTTSDDLETVFGLSGSEEMMAQEIKEQFGFKVVVITIRQAPTVLRGSWTSLALADRTYRGRITELELVDRIGSGDAYSAGFIYGYLTGDVAKAVAYGDAMSVLKHSIPGDFSWVTLAEVEHQTAAVVTKIQR